MKTARSSIWKRMQKEGRGVNRPRRDYMPERKDADKGIVSVNRYTRERKKIKGSADGGRWSAYHGHAWRRIEEMLDAGELKKEAYAAWY